MQMFPSTISFLSCARLSVCVITAVLLVFPGVASAQTAAYSIVDLGLESLEDYAQSLGINNAGQTTGTDQSSENHYPYAQRFKRALRWTTNGSTVTRLYLNPSYPPYDVGYGINDLGAVVGGTSTNGFFVDQALLWSPGTNGTIIRTPLSTTEDGSSAADINNTGQIVGSSRFGTSSTHAVLWTVNGSTVTAKQLETTSGSAAYANGINNLGQVVGSFQTSDSQNHAALWNVNGPAVTQTVLSGFFATANDSAVGIDATGQMIVGTTGNSTDTALHATIWRWNGSTYVPNDYGTIGGTGVRANGINSAGQALFTVTSNPAPYYRPWLYLPATGLQALNTLFGPTPAATDVTVGTYRALNEWGQIAASGTIGGKVHALRLDPITPVSSLAGGVLDAKMVAGMNYQKTPALTDPNGGANPNVFGLMDGTVGKGTAAGVTGSNREVTAQFVTNPSSAPIVGNAANFQGAGSDDVVVQFSYDKGVAATLFGSESNTRVGWYNGTRWVNAVDGNTGGAATFVGARAYNAATDLRLGACGVDLANHTVWAVVNHGGVFGVVLDPEVLKKLKSFSRPGTLTTLTMDSFTGYTYQLQRASTLVDATSFVDVGNPQTGSTGTVLGFTGNDGAATQGFYRVKITP